MLSESRVAIFGKQNVKHTCLLTRPHFDLRLSEAEVFKTHY